MDSPYLPAVAALAGSAIGGLTSFASAWLTQRHQDRANRLSRDKARRQKVYRQFIEEASKLYADALVHDDLQISTLVSRLRLDKPNAGSVEPSRAPKGGRGHSNDNRNVFLTQQDPF